jgi:dienelactone hydrolase
MSLRLWLLLAGLVVLGAEAEAARQETYPLPSLTLSDPDFLVGKEGKPVTLKARLKLPQGQAEKYPAVIILHGSSGRTSDKRMEHWAGELNEIGIAAFLVDSFTGRGITETNTDPTRLGRLNMIIDAYKALELLSKHPDIDSKRIAVLGFSRGGQSALYSSMTRFYKSHGPRDGAHFVAHVGFYPACTSTYLEDEEVNGVIRILHGTADDYSPIAPCRSYVKRLQAAGKDAELIEYPGAHHVFDGVHLKNPKKLDDAITVRHCRVAEASKGRLINQATGKLFSYKDACVTKGPTIAFDENANRESRAYVRDFFKQVFGLDERVDTD